MDGTPALVRRHRGLVAQVWSKLRNFGPDSVKDLQFFVEAAEMVQALDKGEDYLGHKRNSFWCAYYSQADGSGQPFVVHVPKDFNPRKSYPLLVSLHGSGLRPAPDPTAPFEKSYISVDPWGRGDNGFAALGDNDVREVIHYMRTWYPIDVNRIYLAGGSMGGYGTWAIASRHPDQFAAAAPVCGWASGLPLENLRNMPVFDQHGRQDWMVSIDQSQWAVDRLRQLDYPVVYRSTPMKATASSNPGRSMNGCCDKLDPSIRLSSPSPATTRTKAGRTGWPYGDSLTRIRRSRCRRASSGMGRGRRCRCGRLMPKSSSWIPPEWASIGSRHCW